jgi:hypothetical protein
MTASINASTSAGVIVTSDTSGDIALQSAGTTKLTVSSTGAYGQLVSGTAQASTSGTSIDFTSIPSWVKRITVMFSGVSTTGTSGIGIQIGSGSVSNTGYSVAASYNGPTNGGTTSTSQFLATFSTLAANASAGNAYLTLQGSNIWTFNSVLILDGAQSYTSMGAGTKTLSGTLDRVRITTVNGTDTFDAGSINILYEG